MTYLHYRLGIEHVNREAARARLDMFSAVGFAMTSPKDEGRKTWFSLQRMLAEWE